MYHLLVTKLAPMKKEEIDDFTLPGICGQQPKQRIHCILRKHTGHQVQSKKRGMKMNYKGGKKTEPKRVLPLKDKQKKKPDGEKIIES